VIEIQLITIADAQFARRFTVGIIPDPAKIIFVESSSETASDRVAVLAPVRHAHNRHTRRIERHGQSAPNQNLYE
jgi:hypothetical protein